MKNAGKILGLLLIVFAGFWLYKVFRGQIVLAQFFQFGFVKIHFYGVTLALAVLSAWAVTVKRATEYSIALQVAESVVFWVIIGGFIGARLWHVLTAWEFYAANPVQVFMIWNGGLAIYGAILGGLLVLLLSAKYYQAEQSIYDLLDWLVPGVVLGQAIGRLGNLFNYELFGYPTNLAWKMFVPENFRPETYQLVNFFHPLFLYEFLACVAIFLFLKKISSWQKNGKKLPAGTLFFSYLLLYNVVRFLIELLRVETTIWSGIRLNLAISLMLVLVSSLWLFLHLKKKPVLNEF